MATRIPHRSSSVLKSPRKDPPVPPFWEIDHRLRRKGEDLAKKFSGSAGRGTKGDEIEKISGTGGKEREGEEGDSSEEPTSSYMSV